MPCKRQCPTCGVELTYGNLAGFQRSNRTKALCRRCAASPAVIQRRLQEIEQRRAAGGNFMAGFFESVEASLSGSAVRK